MENPRRNSIPAWYELSYLNKSIIVIRVHRTALSEMVRLNWRKSPMVESLLKSFEFRGFSPPGEKDWGFNNSMRFGQAPNPDWVTWECPLPKIGGKTGTPHKEVMALRATLYMLFTALSIFDGNTGWEEP